MRRIGTEERRWRLWNPHHLLHRVNGSGALAAAARAALARLYLQAYGPATFNDLQWWTRWNKGQTREALEALERELTS